MSKQNDKVSSGIFNEKKRPVKTPPRTDSVPRKNQKTYDLKKKISENQNFQEISLHEKDQRFKYLLKHGEIKRIEKGGNIIFAQLPQIPNVWVCYRRPVQRDANLQKLSLDSMDLFHIPLLEGQQRLKMLTFQHNKVTKIENLISLPNILYLDLYDNQIKQIQNLTTPTLKVLLLPKNQIQKIKNINQLVKLEVLDLHNNKIVKIQGFGILNSLRVLNLAHNQISKIQNMENLFALTELNLKSNLIANVENLKHLTRLEKLFLANNRIDIKSYEQCQIVKLQNLKELSLQNNPFSKEKIFYFRNVIKFTNWIKLLDGKSPTLVDQPAQSDNESNHDQVITLIMSQWQEQKRRITQIENSNGSKRQFLKTTCVAGGHAEIQDENILFIYGSSYDVVLTNQSFQETVQKIRFQYVFIEFLIEPNVLKTLSKFRKLKILEFKETYIMSLLQIAKLQNLSNLKIISIEPAGNPIHNCTFLKEFIIYRFPGIIQINKQDIKENDRAKAKQLFQHFDKVLQIPQKVYGPDTMRNYPFQEPDAKKDRNYLKNFNKVINEVSDQIVSESSERAQRAFESKQEMADAFDMSMIELIRKTKKAIAH